jgi:hypothetical protein
MSPIAARKAGGDDHIDSGHRHQPSDLARIERGACDQPLDLGDLPIEQLDLAHCRVDRLALLLGQLELGEPAPALDPEEACERGATDQAAHQHRLDLVLRP